MTALDRIKALALAREVVAHTADPDPLYSRADVEVAKLVVWQAEWIQRMAPICTAARAWRDYWRPIWERHGKPSNKPTLDLIEAVDAAVDAAKEPSDA